MFSLLSGTHPITTDHILDVLLNGQGRKTQSRASEMKFPKFMKVAMYVTRVQKYKADAVQ